MKFRYHIEDVKFFDKLFMRIRIVKISYFIIC